MELKPGDKLGPYEIGSSIGKGGMGEVWRAHDPRLGRDVAIKVSAQQFTDRFEREARAIAALNHPNICHLYDVGPNYLVMEYIEGEAPKGPLPLDEALRIARQIADALEAAHEKGIIHRDLKPANIKIKPDGTVKVLDFGLAKNAGPSAELTADSPTFTVSVTHAGMILGTAAYMAPEQARGKPVDKRADIWAFGVVLFEMLAGERPFQGSDITEVLASVVKDEPEWNRVPAAVRPLLRRCLEKDPKKRLRDIGDAMPLVENAAPLAAPPASQFALAEWIAAAVLLLGATALGFVWFRQRPPVSSPVVRFQIPAPDSAGIASPVVSPDGKQVLYQGADRRLWIRTLDSLDAKPLAGTDASLSQPFWSADSRFVVFSAGGKLWKIDASGGPPQSLCDFAGYLRGGFWTADNRIVFASAPGGLQQVAPGGGNAAALPVGSMDAVGPFSAQLLPDGHHLIFRSQSGIYASSLDGRENPKRLLPDLSRVAWAPVSIAASTEASGYLLFLRDGTLLAQPFNPSRLELSGDPVPIAQRVRSFSVSQEGTLIYRTGAGGRKLTWFDRHGKVLGNAGAAANYNELALSPDGSRVAVVRPAGIETGTGNARTWIHQFSSETSMRLTTGESSIKPLWSPDGSRVIFSSTRAGGPFDLYQKLSNGTGDAQLLLKSNIFKWPWSWSRDGQWLLYGVDDPKTKQDLWLLPMVGEHKPQPFLITDFTETDGAFSPDGRFVAYVSDESGKFEVYVRSFPSEGGGKWVVSSDGGYQPRWRSDGREMFYFTAGGRLMSVDVAPAAVFHAGVPKLLFEAPIFGGGATIGNRFWDVTPDGQRFLINTLEGGAATTPITVVLNWQAGLKE